MKIEIITESKLCLVAMHILKTFFQQFYNPPQSNTLGSLEFERYPCTSSIAVEYQYFLLRLFSVSSQNTHKLWGCKPSLPDYSFFTKNNLNIERS